MDSTPISQDSQSIRYDKSSEKTRNGPLTPEPKDAAKELLKELPKDVAKDVANVEAAVELAGKAPISAETALGAADLLKNHDLDRITQSAIMKRVSEINMGSVFEYATKLPTTMYSYWTRFAPLFLQARLSQISRLTTIQEKYLLCVSFWAAFILLGKVTTMFMICMTHVVPGFMSMKALETGNEEIIERWLKYWVIFGLINTIEFTLPRLLLRITPFGYVKFFAILWCIMPIEPRGTDIIYHFFIANRLKEKAQQAASAIKKFVMLSIFKRGKGKKVEGIPPLPKPSKISDQNGKPGVSADAAKVAESGSSQADSKPKPDSLPPGGASAAEEAKKSTGTLDKPGTSAEAPKPGDVGRPSSNVIPGGAPTDTDKDKSGLKSSPDGLSSSESDGSVSRKDGVKGLKGARKGDLNKAIRSKKKKSIAK